MALLSSTTCAGSTHTTVNTQDEIEAIAAALDDFHAAASQANEERYFAHFTPDAVFIGTDATERWNMVQFRAFAHPHFSRGRGWTYKMEERHIRMLTAPDTALFDEELVHATYGALRGSGVLVKREGRWLIEHYVLSFSVPNESVEGLLKAISKSRNAAPGNDEHP